MRRREFTRLVALAPALGATAAGSAEPGAQGGEGARPTDAEARNKELFRRVATELFGRKDLTAIDRHYAPGYVQHVKERAERARQQGIDAREETKRTLGALFAAFPDLELEIDQLAAEGDRVFAMMTLRGTHRGPFLGVAPTGKRVEMRAADVFRIANGKFAEHWDVVDNSQLARALGLGCPAPDAGKGAA